MSTSAPISFDHVWKKFRRGEAHDSLRDLVPSLLGRGWRRKRDDELQGEEFWVLRDVSFAVAPGEALGIIGRNGAGKSTTLKLLTRILKPTIGECSVHGRVGALIEIAAGFHPDLTGRENVYLQGAIMGMKRQEVVRKFDEIVEFSGIGDFIDTQVKRYSSGMNARLGFSIAAHLDPDVLLIDEVLAVGDMAFQQKCMERLSDFRRRGITIAFVSHNMQAIASLCDRALLLRPGQQPLLGPVDDVISAYASAAAADEDPRIKFEAVNLRAAAEQVAVRGPVPPRTRLVLDFRIIALTPLPNCAIEFYVHRSDGLRMFDGVSFTDNLKPVDVPQGSTISGSVSFDAHLLRGTYSIGLALIEEHKRWPGISMPSVASFVVTESTRWGGCAELAPEYSFQVTAGDLTPREATPGGSDTRR